jgi:hypothetical protein
MPDENAPKPRPRLQRTLFWIAGGGFALTGIFAAVDAKWPLAVTFFSLCVVFISVGQAIDRKAEQEASSGGSAKP